MSQALAARTPDSNLSTRERQVLALVAKGNSNKEIAVQLGITEATVKCHVSVILMRLSASDRNAGGGDRFAARSDSPLRRRALQVLDSIQAVSPRSGHGSTTLSSLPHPPLKNVSPESDFRRIRIVHCAE